MKVGDKVWAPMPDREPLTVGSPVRAKNPDGFAELGTVKSINGNAVVVRSASDGSEWSAPLSDVERDLMRKRAEIKAIIGPNAVVQAVIGHREWQVPLSKLIEVFDSGETGSASAKSQRQMLGKAREHLANARRLIKPDR